MEKEINNKQNPLNDTFCENAEDECPPIKNKK